MVAIFPKIAVVKYEIQLASFKSYFLAHVTFDLRCGYPCLKNLWTPRCLGSRDERVRNYLSLANCYSSCYREMVKSLTMSLPTDFIQFDR